MGVTQYCTVLVLLSDWVSRSTVWQVTGKHSRMHACGLHTFGTVGFLAVQYWLYTLAFPKKVVKQLP